MAITRNAMRTSKRSKSSLLQLPESTRRTRQRSHIRLGERGSSLVLPVKSEAVPPLVTPETSVRSYEDSADTVVETIDDVRRSLFASNNVTVSVTPARDRQTKPKSQRTSPAQRRLLFGRSIYVAEVAVSDNVRLVYSVVKKLTGSIGGNGSFGPIYGELTMGSMQKMINLCKEYAELDASSRFLDVGSGIGKPNLHVSQDPGVVCSVGVEVEVDRWILGMNCLKGVLDAKSQQTSNTLDDICFGHRCLFLRGDITEAKTFNPFSHVYMFSIGFPPLLWCELSTMWNRSASSYLICYHGPKNIIDRYAFDVELVVQTQTSMHGSKEGHTGYIYRRIKDSPLDRTWAERDCDSFYAPALDLIERGEFDALKAHVNMLVGERMNPCGPLTRSKKLYYSIKTVCMGASAASYSLSICQKLSSKHASRCDSTRYHVSSVQFR